MPSYRAPLDEIRFVFEELLGVGALSALPGYEEATPEMLAAVLEEGARLCVDVLAPLNQPGDAEGCHLEDGFVRTPTGFRDAYVAYREGGWAAMTADPAYGGQGLPHLARLAFQEMLYSANLSFGMYPELAHGATSLLERWASDELKGRFLPKLVDGTWTGTMCLTEPHAGTDLGLIRTRAEPVDDGSYRVTGTKIFISAGDHDLAENIVHLILAKLPGAPPGTRGISLFVVPKRLPDGSGGVGEGNGVTCRSLEHKMGIRANATCVLEFENARGWLVGEPHRGMPAMFTMMNAARLGVGIQGLALGEVAYQNAVTYARERLQGRAPTGAREPARDADPIIVHPDVRRLLMTMKSLVEGTRALAYWVGLLMDVEAKHPDQATREEASDLVALMTPVVKSFLTETGFEVTNHALQCFGGHGYIREYGMEQFVRDARIALIYEGTNGVQAMDLVGRKLPEGDGRLLRRFLTLVHGDLAATGGEAEEQALVAAVADALRLLETASATLAARGRHDPNEPAAAGADYLRLLGLVATGWMWIRMVRAARGDAARHRVKLATARFYMDRILPQSRALAAQIDAGAASVMALDAADF